MTTEVSTVFSRRFEEIKNHFKLRNSDLAKMGGVTDAAIGKIMKGKTENPDISLLVNLVKKLNLNSDWILLGEGEMVRSNNGSLSNTREEYYREKLQNSYRTIADLTEFVGKSKGVSRKSRIASSAPRPAMPSTNLFGMNAAEG